MPKSTRAKRPTASLTLVYDDGSTDVFSGSVTGLRSLLLEACADPEIVGSLEAYQLYQDGRLVDAARLAGCADLVPVVRAWRQH